MLIVETIGRIRREHFVQGKSIKEIGRTLKLSRNTVRKVLRSEDTSFSYERQVQCSRAQRSADGKRNLIGFWPRTPRRRDVTPKNSST